jgi:hypothetical protein
MIMMAHQNGVIENDDIPGLGEKFGDVYRNIETIVDQRMPEARLHILMSEWGIFESGGKTE